MPRKAVKCSYKNCMNMVIPHKENPLCREHYLLNTKDKKYTNETKHGRPKNNSLCKLEDCNKEYYCLDYCRTHYLRFKKYGNPLLLVHQPDPAHCTFLGCSDPCHAKGFCQKHYWRNQRYGNPNITHKNNEHIEKCSINDCNRQYYAKDYCKSHYMIYEYGKVGNHDDMELFLTMCNVREKYLNTCQWYRCGKSRKINHIQIHVHHIFPKAEYPELKYREDYMITYCKFHHIYWHEKRYEKMGKRVDLNSVNILRGNETFIYNKS